MKPFLVCLILALNLSMVDFARAAGPEYFSSRVWIKERAHAFPQSGKIIYLGDIKGQKGFLIPYEKTLKLRDLISLTSFKGLQAQVIILREKRPFNPVYASVIPSDGDGDFALQPDDVIWVVDPSAVNT